MLDPVPQMLIKLQQKLAYLATLCCLATALAASPALANTQGSIDYGDYEQALVSFNERDYSATIIHLKNMLQQQPAHLPSRVLMAEVYLEQRQPLLAESELNYARRAGADLDRLSPLLARGYNMMRRFEDTLEITRPSRRPAQLESELAVIRGQAYIGLDRLTDAGLSIEYALQKNPTSINALQARLQLAMLRRQFPAASGYADELLALDSSLDAVWVTRAKLHSIRDDNEQALLAVTKAIVLAPDNDAARLARASFYIDIGRYADAEADVDHILEKYPLEPRSKYLKAIIVSARGDTAASSEAMDEIAKTLQALDSGVMDANPDYYFLAAVTNNQLGNQDLARDYVNRYGQIVSDDVRALRLLAIIELQSGAPLAARNAALKANRLSPNNTEVLALLGSAYLGLGEFQQAYRAFERVETMFPGSINNLVNLARVKLAQKNYLSAIDYLLKAETLAPDSIEIQLLLIEGYQQSRQIDSAITKAAALLERNPESSLFMQVYAESLGLAGRIEEAVELFEASLRQSPSNRVTTVFLSRIDLGLGRHDEAINRLLQFREKYGDSQPLLIEIADTYTFTKQPEEAIYWLTKALDNNASSELALEKLVKLQDAGDNRDEAIRLCVAFLRRVTDSTNIHQLLAGLYLKDQLNEEALKHYSSAVKYSKYPPEALLTKAKAQLSFNDVPGAQYSLNRAIALDAEYLPARVELSRIAITLGETKTARQLIREIEAIAPDKPAAAILSGDLYNRLRDFADAEAAYRRALEFGDTVPAIMGLYSVYSRTGRYALIIPELEAWLRKYPSDVRVSLATAAAYRALGNYEQAERYYLQLIEKHPESVVILNNAANLFRDKGDYDNASIYAARARDLAPNNATVIDTLAWIEVKKDNLEEALQLLRRAMILDNDSPEIKYHLAVTLDLLGRRNEALTFLRESVTSPVSFPAKSDAEKLLSEWR
ncbi:PEP-CTERM system TPR-repeat protein PrsT [Halieaceae bacterium IMCC14734]|uniref:PEP-CTERM system TPR-repeat protein PrsT n=1 Tax=Candidatus Litorirhabdus singularis TaxID=2518993 RepID=A0ABT3TFP8_9GAMM|nr:XrtA/PEP-CTERM system TPR-repeat protein PrsT [Candidatus Litorirhabdus singularis]MCX2981030.1 PEP-CTERM system TPR-repeat protein PrsT [Candidatus Litorirhabdus singularis]